MNAFARIEKKQQAALSPVKKIGFLFNHEQTHQIPHSVPIMNALCEQNDAMEISVYVTGNDRATFVRKMMSDTAKAKAVFHVLHPPFWARTLNKVLGNAVPFERIGVLARYRFLFADLDALVVPETTSTMLKTRFGQKHLKLIFTTHGAGDRVVSFNKLLHEFDYILLPGAKEVDKLKAQQIVLPEDKCSEVGCAKFDSINFKVKPKFFSNDNLTVLFNPHFHPGLSCGYEYGLQVLEFFRKNPQYNLIFAPHVMMFSRFLHIGLGPLKVRRRFKVPERYMNIENILVDTGSDACVDASYTRAADVYMGDVSSQVYEFIVDPKPCIFINTHNVAWQHSPYYRNWHFGKVIASPTELGSVLSDMSWHQDYHIEKQRRAVAETFGEQVTGASVRAANVIRQFLQQDMSLPSPAFADNSHE
ncbi:hypothetical protein [Kordiimonas pumila]|uniref:Glycerophosphotransferase n=1 Tax=Kordiimonas pumila TaxID=2161677 RepID=A0ABV7D6C7_9PROT|nr:hypothetical protein [Kordiimonas pumila]